MKFRGQRIGLGEGFLADGGGDIAPDGADEDILRGVGEIDKFEELDLIALPFQQVAADGVGREGGKALPDDAVPGEDGEAVRLQLGVQLVLAAGDGKADGFAYQLCLYT